MKVYIIGLHLFILGLRGLQIPYGNDESTQMYYAVLTVGAGVLQNVTQALNSFILNTAALKVNNLTWTTKCEVSEDMSRCSCLDGHIWSSQVCERSPHCCRRVDSDSVCSLPKDVDPICHPKTRVTIKGSIYLSNEIYYHSLTNHSSVKFKELSAALISKMKPSYSTLQGFDDIQFTMFRQGVYAYFEAHINRKMSTHALALKTSEAAERANATFTVATEGLVDINKRMLLVRLYSTVNLVCEFPEAGVSDQEWNQTTLQDVSQITNGTESVLTSVLAPHGTTTTLTLTNTSGIWAGLITCTFRTTSCGVKINHRASVALDVALLPQIDILSEPQFPHCSGDSTVVAVTVKCEISNSTEPYVTEWTVTGNNDRKTDTVKEEDFNRHTIVYALETAVGCLAQDERSPATVVCAFTNRKGQRKDASLQVNVIFKHDLFCPAVDDWPATKVGFTAKLRCEKRSGVRLRTCMIHAKWGEEESQCVNFDLFKIGEDTLTINKGLGSVYLNSARLFSRLTNATNDTGRINTVSNLNTSINILDNMQKLNNTFNESTLDNILESSSNILNVPLEQVWKPPRYAQSNVSMAQVYLESVERLIRLTDISKPLTREVSNIQMQTCMDVGCERNVFNVTVAVGGPGGGLVKMAGFKNLINFLPLEQPNAEPNSIVVTASVDGERVPDVSIHFQLTSPRPRNHGMRCLAVVGGKWSPDRCTWAGPSDEGACRCRGSNAYALALSNNVIDLPLLKEITSVGLACSIISLVTFMVVEFLIWKTVVMKSNSLYLRHTTLVNISVSLLVGNCSLLASRFPGIVSNNWCQACVVLQHFFYLAQFFWMFCLSTLLLYQTMFVFSDLSKGRYQGVCYVTGYGIPFLIVITAFVTHDGGAEGMYYDSKSCWLTHHGLLQGSFYFFIIPVGIIVFFNLFSMAMVIIKLLNHPKVGGGATHNSHHGALRILRSVVILTPVFGVTWIFGFATMALDLASGPAASAVYYTFSICNSFQGLFILLTTCAGEKMVRDALKNRMSVTLPPSSTMETSLTLQSVKDK